MPDRLSAVIIGAGHRSMYYASFALSHPDRLRIVGVADPDRSRRERAAQVFSIPAAYCFQTAEELAINDRFADFAINGTMDHLHVQTSLPLLEKGYHLLLEKPFAVNEDELWRLVNTANQNKRIVAICHVLRHTPFYSAIRQRVLESDIGDIFNIQAVEHVSYHHMAVGYVRGKWRSKARTGSSMLLAKSCHDLDLIAWMKSGVRPEKVASFGSNYQFRPEKAPLNSGTRCIVDCTIEQDCLYSARKHYLDHPDRWSFYVWDTLEHKAEINKEDRIESLKTSPYGLCVWKTDMDVLDHQSLVIEFADGCTGTLNMIGGSAKPSRSLHLVGTRGEIQGAFEDNRFVIRWIDPRPGHEFAEEIVDLDRRDYLSGEKGGHGGGDLRLVEDFLDLLTGRPPSISTTHLDDSISSHLIAFGADRSLQSGIVELIRWK